MPTTADATPIPIPTNDDKGGQSQSLTLVLVDPNGKNDHYAIVPFPETYEDAKAAAIETLGSYIDEDAPDIILRRSLKNRKGEWVWANIPPKQWKTMVGGSSTEVGVFAQPRNVPKLFVHGPVHFTYCDDMGKGISWSSIDPKGPNARTRNGMDRPKSFAEASEVARDKVSPRILAPMSEGDTLTFCTFPDGKLFTYIPIPEEAHTDDALWQKLVPRPGWILGVIINRKA